MPDKNPVEVSVKLKGFNYKGGGKKLNNPDLKSKILIFDNLYSLHVEAVVKIPLPGSTENNVTYQDMSEMTLEIKKEKIKIYYEKV